LVSHRKAAVVTASATQRSLAQESVPLRPDYAGPTGLQTVILRALGDSGIPGCGLWAQVRYLARHPERAEALFERLVDGPDELGDGVDVRCGCRPEHHPAPRAVIPRASRRTS